MAGPRLSLAQVEGLNLKAYQDHWRKLHGEPAPSLTLSLLRFGLAYRLQCQHTGAKTHSCALMPSAKQRVHSVRKLTVDTKLIRDWYGIVHQVIVLEGGFSYAGQNWPSLSAIAKAITGTKWSGPRFFGLQA